MTRAKKLLETFTWNPNWGTPLKIKHLHRVEYPYPAYIFRWNNIDLVIVKDGKVWWVSEYHTAHKVTDIDVRGEFPISHVYEVAIRELDKIGVENIKLEFLGYPITRSKVTYKE